MSVKLLLYTKNSAQLYKGILDTKAYIFIIYHLFPKMTSDSYKNGHLSNKINIKENQMLRMGRAPWLV